MQSIFNAKEKPWIGGHRGTAVYCPENTIPAFNKALEAGADYVELDVRLSRDGIPVVIHNDTIDGTTNGTGKIRDYTVEELKRFDAGGYFAEEFKGVRIPTLEEVLVWARGKIWLSIEIKDDGDYSRDIEALIIDCAAKHGMTDQVLIMANDSNILKRIKELNGSIMTCLLGSGPCEKAVMLAKQAGAEILNIPHSFITEELVNDAHRNKLLVHASLINDPCIWREVRKLGVDMVDTDIPDMMRETDAYHLR